MGHGYLGCEHLLLALIADADPSLAALLSRFQINYQEVKNAILASLPQDAATWEENETIPVNQTSTPWGTLWDTPATGVPRRFGLALMFLVVTLYALLFSGMKLLGAPPVIFAVVATLITGVGFGQVLLFSGKYPRIASIWVGAVLFPLEILVVQLVSLFNPSNTFTSDDDIATAIVSVVVSIPGGAIFGYLSGCLTAGIFFLLDLYAKKTTTDNGPEEETPEPD